MGQKALSMLGARALGPVDISMLTRIAKDDHGLLRQPPSPPFTTCVVQVYVRCQPNGGQDKSPSGHRYDTIMLANGLIRSGLSCQPIHYVHQEHSNFFEVCRQFDVVIVRCTPDEITVDGGDWKRFDDDLRGLQRMGKQVWPSPEVMEQMSAKDTLVKLAKLNMGLEDTVAYYTPHELEAGFKKSVAFQPRVIKQNRGSSPLPRSPSGEGVWIVKLKDERNYCQKYGARKCGDKEMLVLQEASDNHIEEHTVGEFIEFCVKGRTAKSGFWTSAGHGKYLEGGKAKGGHLVDQRFCPRTAEGVVRYTMMGNQPVSIMHKKPKEVNQDPAAALTHKKPGKSPGQPALEADAGSVDTYYEPNEVRFGAPTLSLLKYDLPNLMATLGLGSEPLPLVWTADLINSSMHNTDLRGEKWILSSLSCSCVDVLPCFCAAAACSRDDNVVTTDAFTHDGIPPKVLEDAQRLYDLMGEKAWAAMAALASPSTN
jgi:hypothetical protein